jgi:hypothetical protein
MLRWICNTLCILCEDSAEARKELGKAGGIEILAGMMDPEHVGNFSEKVKINACLALNNGCTGDGKFFFFFFFFLIFFFFFF